MTTKHILLIPGDGIGPEIVAEAVKVLEALNLEIATPAEARALLALKGGDQVAF